MPGYRQLVPVVLLAALPLACSGNSTEQASAVIGSEGGTLRSVDERMTLTIPPGALDETTTITIAALADAQLPAGALPGTGTEFGPDGLTFAKPVDLTVTYRPEDVDPLTGAWLRVVQLLPNREMIPTELVTHDTDARQITARLTHFSSYVVIDLNTTEATIERTTMPVSAVDVLFVIDDSASMYPLQQTLIDNFPRFVDQLDKAQLSYRLGVTSTSLGAGEFSEILRCEEPGGDGGKLLAVPRSPDCPTPSDAWIESTADGTNVPDDDVGAAFACIAALGGEGCDHEQPLEAAYLALDPATNPGFLRPHAALAVVFITNEDDCSAQDDAFYDPFDAGLGPSNFRCFRHGTTCDINGETAGLRRDCKPADAGPLHPVRRYGDRLKQLKPPEDLFVSAISAPASPVEVVEVPTTPGSLEPRLLSSCKRTIGETEIKGFPAVRLAAFVEGFGEHGSMSDVCKDSFDPALERLGRRVAERKMSWCLSHDPIDTNTLIAGIQADCSVETAVGDVLPTCPDSGTGDKPCYRLVDQPLCSSSNTKLELANTSIPQVGNQVKVACLVQ